MDIRSYYQKVRQYITEQRFDELRELKLEKPERFDWVRDIFKLSEINLPHKPESFIPKIAIA